jgi:four helix bundle protein
MEAKMNGKKKVEKFEDLIAWQKARVLTKDIYTVTRQGAIAKDRNLTNQLQRSAISMMSNIAEGFERGRRTEFHQFTSIAKSSCGELRSQLYTAFDVGYLSEVEFKQLMTLAEELGRILGGLRASLEKQKAK